jgi:L-ascorbate 6-phosphate lactonase
MTSLIRPVRCGRELDDEIRSTRPAAGALAVWWLGQSGFVLKSRSGTLVIDPYLSDHLTRKYEGTDRPHVRMTESPLGGADLTGVDLVLSSHKHSDHLDPGTMPALMAASPGAVLALPAAIVAHARGLGLPGDRLVGLEAGSSFTRAGFSARAIPAAHEGLETDDRGRPLYLGFVVEVDGLRLYHSGDSLAYDGLEGWLGPGPFEVFFLPINGRDPARGVPGNMTAAEAVALAARCRPRFVVPHHYDMFTFNTVPVAEFEAAARLLPEGVTPRVLRCGERWLVSGTRAVADSR